MLSLAVPASAGASHFEFCELHGRIATEPKADAEGHSVAVSLRVESVEERRRGEVSSYVDGTDYLGRSIAFTLSVPGVARRSLHVGDALGIYRAIVVSADGVSNEGVELLDWTPASLR